MCRGDGRGAVVDLRLCFENVIEAAHGSGAALKNVGDPTQRNHRPNENAEIAIKGDQCAERNSAGQHEMAALPENDKKRDADHGLERGHEHAPSTDELDVARDVLTIGFIEAVDFGFLLGVSANDADTGEIFLNFGGERRERSLDFFVEFVDHFAEMLDDNSDKRHRKKNPQRELARKLGHHRDGEGHADNGLAAVHDAGTEDHAHGVEVVSGAGHEFAGAVAHIKLGFEQKKAIQQAAADVEFDVARNADENPASKERKNGAYANERDEQKAIDAKGVAAVRRVEGNRAAQPRASQKMALRAAFKGMGAARENIC